MPNTETATFVGGFASAPDPAGDVFRVDRVLPLLTVWDRRRRYRQDLKRLLKVGPYMIADIGLSLADALDEIEKPFWRA